MNTRPLVISSLLALLLVACATGPDYQAPKLDVPATWSGTDNAKELANLDHWWQRFDDPVLQQMIDAALSNNFDLQNAALRVDEAQALVKSSKADHYPSVLGNAGVERQRTSTLAEPTLVGINTNSTNYSLGLNLDYEIDLWGKLRRADEAARARLLSSAANRDAVRQGLIAAVVDSYINLRALDAQLEIAKQTVTLRQQSLALQQHRLSAGVVGDLDVSQAQSALDDAQVVVPQLEQSIALQENALAVLQGKNPGALPRGKDIGELSAVPAIPAGLPSQLLERRPDIRAAEQDLIAANADIGVAKASYYPTLSLTGMLGMESGQLSDLFKNGAHTWGLGAGISGPLFTGGKADAAEKIAETRKQEALVSYRQTVNTVFHEVADALVNQHSSHDILSARQQQLQSATNTRQLAQKRYQQGLTGQLDMLDAERQLFQAQLGVIDSQRSEAHAVVTMYKALGGGWQASN